MRQLTTFILMLIVPIWSLAQNYYGPLNSYFNSDGTSIYNEMAIDSMDVLDRNKREVKVAYDEDCRVKSIFYTDDYSGQVSNFVNLEYYENGGPKVRRVLKLRDTGITSNDTIWYNTNGRIIKVHDTNSDGSYERKVSNTFDDKGRSLTQYSMSLYDVPSHYNYTQMDKEYVYVSESQIDVYESRISYYGIESNPIDTIESDTKKTYYMDEGRIDKVVSVHSNNEIIQSYTYDDDRLIEIVETYNGTVRGREVRSYTDAIPECVDWTNDIWEVDADQEVETVTFYDKRYGDLKPNERRIKSKNSFGRTTFSLVETANAFGEWETERKSLYHYDDKGGSLYAVRFEVWAGEVRPRWLYAYETNSSNQITRSVSHEYELETSTWSQPTFEQINNYNENGDISSRIVTNKQGVEYFSWDYTDFGALSRTTSPDGDSHFYYSERCKGEDVEPSAEEPTIYPNPVSTVLTLAPYDPETELAIKVYTIDGKLVMNFNSFPNEQLDVSSLAPGLYVLKYFMDKNIRQHKFVKI